MKKKKKKKNQNKTKQNKKTKNKTKQNNKTKTNQIHRVETVGLSLSSTLKNDKLCEYKIWGNIIKI